MLYETTQFFLEHFGLRNLDELPNSDELKRRELPRAPVAAEPPSEPALLPDEAGAVDRSPSCQRRVARDFRRVAAILVA